MNEIGYWRLKYINHGLTQSHERFKSCLKDNPNNLDVFTSLNELLYWIGTSDEWHEQNKKRYKQNDANAKYIYGLRYVYNSLKHEMGFLNPVRTTKAKELIKGSGYFTEDYSADIIWANVEIIPEVKGFEKQRKNYESYIQGEKVIETVDGACQLLREKFIQIRQQEHEENEKRKKAYLESE